MSAAPNMPVSGAATLSRWLVLHRDGACATASGRQVKDDTLSEKTLCGYFVTLPSGTQKAEPDCPECLAILRGEAEAVPDIEAMKLTGREIAVLNAMTPDFLDLRAIGAAAGIQSRASIAERISGYCRSLHGRGLVERSGGRSAPLWRLTGTGQQVKTALGKGVRGGH